ncbi:unnamed protein product [Cyprideis torosa]|uniref:Uncharacterized protein n=1 Tax=Cyprideis torosa TaxID=163714 RepID=A0A7R8WMU3_9CRUS|nr:unnamed protein product [Cyprideis torosa]CAG0899647.1 unnamed protein product [Cyprideis torosa]
MVPLTYPEEWGVSYRGPEDEWEPYNSSSGTSASTREGLWIWTRFPDGTELPVPAHWLPEWPHSSLALTAFGTILLIITLLGGIGNGIVIWIFRRYRCMRKSATILVINLATADLLNGVTHTLATLSSFRGIWQFHYIGCKVYAGLVGFFGIVSILTLSLIAVERLHSIANPRIFRSRRITPKRIKQACAFVWLSSLLIIMPPYLGWGNYVPDGLLTHCTWDFFSQTVLNRTLRGRSVRVLIVKPPVVPTNHDAGKTFLKETKDVDSARSKGIIMQDLTVEAP